MKELSKNLKNEMEYFVDILLKENIETRDLDEILETVKNNYQEKVSALPPTTPFEVKATRFVNYYLDNYYKEEEFAKYRTDSIKAICIAIFMYMEECRDSSLSANHVRRYLGEKRLATPTSSYSWDIKVKKSMTLLIRAFNRISIDGYLRTYQNSNVRIRSWAALKSDIRTMYKAIESF